MMPKKFYYLLAIVLFGFTWPTTQKLTIFLVGDSTMSLKEVQAYPETGWGMPFAHFFDSSVQIQNHAKNGRSTKSFIAEGRWKAVTKQVQAGDYVFIQFGHNDESKEKTDRYTEPNLFKQNLVQFITDVKQLKAIPVLITPVSRRYFDSAGKIKETHPIYAQLTQEVAQQQQVIVFDLNELSKALYQELGDDKSKLLFMHLKPNEHPNYPKGKKDDTHFNELGARLIAQLVLKEIREKIPQLASKIVQGKK